MFPMMWIQLACMNIELKTISTSDLWCAAKVFLVDGQTAITSEYGFVPCEVQHICRLGDDRVDLGANAPFVVHHVPVLLTIFTSMFLHGGWAHVGFNMLFLWIFGNNVEDRLGRFRFLLFYLAGGVAAVALQWFASQSSDVPTIGASAGVGADGSEGGGVAYFAHVGGFAFGLLTVKLFDRGVPP